MGADQAAGEIVASIERRAQMDTTQTEVATPVKITTLDETPRPTSTSVEYVLPEVTATSSKTVVVNECALGPKLANPEVVCAQSHQPLHGAAPRFRWADLSDSDGDVVSAEFLDNPRNFPSFAPVVDRASHSGRRQNKGVASTEVLTASFATVDHGPARTRCSRCNKLTDRSGFSRRAWRRARDLERDGVGPRRPTDGNAACLACTAEHVLGPM